MFVNKNQITCSISYEGRTDVWRTDVWRTDGWNDFKKTFFRSVVNPDLKAIVFFINNIIGHYYSKRVKIREGRDIIL